MDRNPTREMTLLGSTLTLGVALAANVTRPVNVSTPVAKNCSMANPANVNLGAYDPLGTGDVAGTTTIGLQCVKKAAHSVSLNSANGWNLKGSSPTDLIPYAIYQPNGTLWNTSAVVEDVAHDKDWKYYTATIRAAQGANVPVGVYSDTVTVVVTY